MKTLGNLDIDATLKAIDDRFNRSSWSEYSDFNGRCETKWFVNWIAVFQDEGKTSRLSDDTTSLQGSIIHRLIDHIYNEEVYKRPELSQGDALFHWIAQQTGFMLDMITNPMEAQTKEPFVEYFRVHSTRSNQYFLQTDHGKEVAKRFVAKGLDPSLAEDLSPCFVNVGELQKRYSGVAGLKKSIPKSIYASLHHLMKYHPPLTTLIESKWFYTIEDGTEEGTQIKALVDFLSTDGLEIPKEKRIATDEGRRLPEGKGKFILTDGKTRYWKNYTKEGQLNVYAFIVSEVSGWEPSLVQFFDFTEQKYVPITYDPTMKKRMQDYAAQRKGVLRDIKKILLSSQKQGHKAFPSDLLGMSLRPSKSRCRFCKAIGCPVRSTIKPYMVNSFSLSQQFMKADAGEVSL